MNDKDDTGHTWEELRKFGYYNNGNYHKPICFQKQCDIDIDDFNVKVMLALGSHC